MEWRGDETLGAIVGADYRAAAVLQSHGLDFCRGARRTLDEACRHAGIDPRIVHAALDSLGQADERREVPDASWPADALADYIVRTHHTFVRRQLVEIAAHLDRLLAAHAGRHPELGVVREHFAAVGDELRLHLRKEEEILFPYIRALARSASRQEAPPPDIFGTVANPIRMMEEEHRGAGNELEVLRALTANFRVPDDGCATYRACYQALEAFDRDLRTHIHLENNVLFPQAVALEREVGELWRGARG